MKPSTHVLWSRSEAEDAFDGDLPHAPTVPKKRSENLHALSMIDWGICLRRVYIQSIL